ncbi:flagellar assembly protein FliH [Halomonas cupida]|uniref:Flagellar assembly protein FliH n=2 Tax=Halomonas cupida TaxID=44933 RepID=A0A1M7G1Z3_9GAMM|nr:flagellar assembly protein FliH [Halomonas cupida]SHM10185.1 flagellar assembly protein FliH [Halomonas cupida]
MSHQAWTSGSTSWRRWRMDKLPRDDASRQPHDRPEASREPDSEELARQFEDECREAMEAGHREGFTDGHAEGLAAGLEQGLAEGRAQAEAEIAAAIERQVAEALAPVQQLVEQFQAALAQLDDSVIENLSELALATGRQLAGDALKARPRQVVELVRELLQTDPPLVGRQRLWLHPLDRRLVETHLGESLAAAGWSLRDDESQQRGGCRLIGEHGELDATWQGRWEAARGQIRRRAPRQPDRDDGE